MPGIHGHHGGAADQEARSRIPCGGRGPKAVPGRDAGRPLHQYLVTGERKGNGRRCRTRNDRRVGIQREATADTASADLESD